MSIDDKISILRSRYTDEVVEEILTAVIRSNGVAAIARERLRQMTAEGYSAAHDHQYQGQMAAAGACYALNASLSIEGAAPEGVPDNWRWRPEVWKPKSPQRDLERSGALVAAELDVLEQRQSVAAE